MSPNVATCITQDAAALLYQHGIRLRNVFDTQVSKSHRALCSRVWLFCMPPSGHEIR